MGYQKTNGGTAREPEESAKRHQAIRGSQTDSSTQDPQSERPVWAVAPSEAHG